MFLSRLTLDLRDRAVRHDLANPYELHRTILRAFPDAQAGGPGRVLFRVELPRAGVEVVLVQSDQEPLWGRLPTGYLAAHQTKPLAGLAFRAGQRLSFRLRANPTKRAGKSTPDAHWIGKRVGLCREVDQEGWLSRKGEVGGFRVTPESFRLIPEGKVLARKGGQSLQFQAVRFEGVLTVTDPERFLQTLRDGIGSAKGLGFGLLSVAPAEGLP